MEHGSECELCGEVECLCAMYDHMADPPKEYLRRCRERREQRLAGLGYEEPTGLVKEACLQDVLEDNVYYNQDEPEID
jgi:hypothetical protein